MRRAWPGLASLGFAGALIGYGYVLQVLWWQHGGFFWESKRGTPAAMAVVVPRARGSGSRRGGGSPLLIANGREPSPAIARPHAHVLSCKVYAYGSCMQFVQLQDAASYWRTVHGFNAGESPVGEPSALARGGSKPTAHRAGTRIAPLD